jgi:hypothetical protein
MAEIILDKRPDRYDCEIRTGRGHRPLLGNAGAGMNQILDARAVPATVSTRKTKAPRYAAGLLTGAGWGAWGRGPPSLHQRQRRRCVPAVIALAAAVAANRPVRLTGLFSVA